MNRLGVNTENITTCSCTAFLQCGSSILVPVLSIRICVSKVCYDETGSYHTLNWRWKGTASKKHQEFVKMEHDMEEACIGNWPARGIKSIRPLRLAPSCMDNAPGPQARLSNLPIEGNRTCLETSPQSDADCDIPAGPWRLWIPRAAKLFVS